MPQNHRSTEAEAQEAMNFATAALRLSGGELDADAEALSLRYARGEISIDDALAAARERILGDSQR
ncbi:antitoxin VbhA family protein [Prescottella equi]|uniref:antitoxin VbhA family protein n=1 Tax=Rhodococcus hoagii TaxID=43767 RepID=UPI003B824334